MARVAHAMRTARQKNQTPLIGQPTDLDRNPRCELSGSSRSHHPLWCFVLRRTIASHLRWRPGQRGSFGMLLRSWTLHAPKRLLFLVSGVVSGLPVLGGL